MTGRTGTQFLQVDVFTARAGGGNPLGVVIGATNWSDERMQAFAAWTQLVETTYLLPARESDAHYQLRIFTPSREIAFAGHPSIGSAHVALATGMVSATGAQLTQECLAGSVSLRVDGAGLQRRIFVQTPAAEVVSAPPPEGIATVHRILHGLPLGKLSPVLVNGGRRWWLAEVANEADLRAWQADHQAIARLASASDSLGICLFATSSSPGFGLVVRAFPCGVGIDEDPASGAANGLIATYLRLVDPEGEFSNGYLVSQGRELGRDALIEVRYDESGNSWIGGQTQTVITGVVDFPWNDEPAQD